MLQGYCQIQKISEKLSEYWEDKSKNRIEDEK